MICDLHNHSVFSDGTQTPAELVAAAKAAGLSALALTDHNSVAGLPDFIKAAEGNIEIAPGLEFSTDYKNFELHILGLFVREENYAQINDMLREAIRLSDQSKRDLVNRLRDAGYDIDYDEIRRKAGGISINRAHIGAELTEKGYTESIRDAFNRLLDKSLGFYVEPKRLDAFEVIRTIKQMGAVSVLAHPFLSMPEQEIRDFLEQAVPCGLDAMEVYYSQYDEETTRLACEIADSFGIERSGGSDSHGKNKQGISIGCGYGNLAVPYECYSRLRAIHKQRCSQ